MVVVGEGNNDDGVGKLSSLMRTLSVHFSRWTFNDPLSSTHCAHCYYVAHDIFFFFLVFSSEYQFRM